MKTEELEKRLPKNVQLRHVRLAKGGIMKCALAQEVKGDVPTGMFIVYDREGHAWSRFFADSKCPDEVKTKPGKVRNELFVDGFLYKRDKKFDLV